MDQQPPFSGPPPGSPGAVLAAARSHQAAVRAGEAGVLRAAVDWAAMHEPIDGETPVAAWWIDGSFVPLAGPGAPEIAEFAVAEFAAALGLTSAQGRRLIGQALELRYRLPRLWAATSEGKVAVWRARLIAEATMTLDPKTAAWVDRNLAPIAGRVTRPQLDRLVVEAKIRAGHTLELDTEEHSPDTRHVTIFDDQVSFNGTVRLDAELDLADALDLDRALSITADQLKLAGSSDSLEVRRATAIGEMARHQLAFSYDPPDPTSTSDSTAREVGAVTATPSARKQGRPVTLFLHLSAYALTRPGERGVGRCENTRSPIDPEVIRAWCAATDVNLTVTPVLDLNEHLRADAYELPDRLKVHIAQRDGACVFPFCDRPAIRCDKDHLIPWEDGGSTCSCNNGPLCRHHHRHKTHTPWTVKMVEPGVYTWRSPHGYTFLRNPWGTLDVTPPQVIGTPACHHPPDPQEGPPPDG